MVKIDFAFDQISNVKNIKELSVVFYPDSFFYGLWDTDEQLVKSDHHSVSNFGKLISILNKTYKFKIVRLMSTVKPFVHLPREEYEKKYYNEYFDGIYDVAKRKSSKKDIDDFLREEISTLHFMDKSIVKVMQSSKALYKTAHISTALANYTFLIDTDLVSYIEEANIHICYAKDGKFQMYNQYYCEQAEDYLYYILYVMDHFNLDPQSDAVQIGGYITKDSPLMKLLKNYVKNLNIVDQHIKIPSKAKNPKQFYYDLYLCKSCV